MNQASQWTRRQSLWLIAGAVGGWGLHACTQTNDQSQTSVAPVSIGMTTWIGNTPLFIAQEKGFFQERGLDLDVKNFSTVAEAFPAFTVGQLDAISPVTSEAVSLAAQEVDYRTVLVMDTSEGADGILARNTIKSIKDFQGKKIAVQQGGVGHFFLLQVLAEEGLSGNDIQIVNTTPDAAAAAYEAGNIEIAYSYSPYMDKANTVQQGRIIYDSSKMPTAIADVYVFRTEFIENHPESVEAFVDGVLQGLEFLNTNPDEGVAIAAKKLNVTPEELVTQLQGISLPDRETNREMLGNAQSDLYLLKPMTALAKFLNEQNQIKTVPNLSQVLEPRFVQSNG